MAAPGHELPVLVIGAGPTGLAAALELARRGQQVRIVDKSATRSQHSKAIGVNARTLELMEPSGVSERLLASGLRIRRFNFRSAERPLATIDLGRVKHRYDFMLALLQAETERLLEQAWRSVGRRSSGRPSSPASRTPPTGCARRSSRTSRSGSSRRAI